MFCISLSVCHIRPRLGRVTASVIALPRPSITVCNSVCVLPATARMCPSCKCGCCCHICDVYAQAEWCLPDRRLDIPEELDILLAAKRLVEFTAKQPHLELGFSEEARERFDSYGVMFNTRSNQLRKGADADAAAEEGAIELLHCLVCVYVTVELYVGG